MFKGYRLYNLLCLLDKFVTKPPLLVIINHKSFLVFSVFSNQNNIIVYAYHDQGLNPFKIINGNIGINITLGAPFIRISVDHGTAFNIANKNIANYLGCYYQLLEAYRIQKGNL